MDIEFKKKWRSGISRPLSFYTQSFFSISSTAAFSNVCSISLESFLCNLHRNLGDNVFHSRSNASPKDSMCFILVFHARVLSIKVTTPVFSQYAIISHTRSGICLPLRSSPLAAVEKRAARCRALTHYLFCCFSDSLPYG